MRRYLYRRLLLAIPTFFGITLVTFGLMHLAPGDSVLLQSDGTLSAGERAAQQFQRKSQGLDEPLAVRYGRWVSRIVRFDFGTSLRDQRPVSTKIAEALPRTLFLSTTALTLAFLLAVPLGVFAAAKRGRLWDRGLSVLLFLLYSLPSFWVAVTLLLTFGTDRGVVWFPLQGLRSEGAEQLSYPAQFIDLLWHSVLPICCLTYAALASLARQMRSGMLETLNEDFVRTARAKGLSERVVLYRHALRNSLLPMVTLLGLLLPGVVGGSVIVEGVFGIPGMGQLALESLLHRDQPMVMGITTLVALFTLASLLVSDVLYAVVDPRLREGRS